MRTNKIFDSINSYKIVRSESYYSNKILVKLINGNERGKITQNHILAFDSGSNW